MVIKVSPDHSFYYLDNHLYTDLQSKIEKIVIVLSTMHLLSSIMPNAISSSSIDLLIRYGINSN